MIHPTKLIKLPSISKSLLVMSMLPRISHHPPSANKDARSVMWRKSAPFRKTTRLCPKTVTTVVWRSRQSGIKVAQLRAATGWDQPQEWIATLRANYLIAFWLIVIHPCYVDTLTTKLSIWLTTQQHREDLLIWVTHCTIHNRSPTCSRQFKNCHSISPRTTNLSPTLISSTQSWLRPSSSRVSKQGYTLHKPTLISSRSSRIIRRLMEWEVKSKRWLCGI